MSYFWIPDVATLPPWKLLENSIHHILLLQLKRLVTARRSHNKLPTNQGGRIMKHFIVLIGRQDQGQANRCLQGRDWLSSRWSLLFLLQCLGIIRWNRPLTIGAPGAKSFRKHLPMSSNVPVQWNCTPGETTVAIWNISNYCLFWIYYGKTKEEQIEKKNLEINKQIQAMHREDKFRVWGMDKHLFTVSLKKMAGAVTWQKQKWIECVTIAYETWVALKGTRLPLVSNTPKLE